MTTDEDTTPHDSSAPVVDDRPRDHPPPPRRRPREEFFLGDAEQFVFDFGAPAVDEANASGSEADRSSDGEPEDATGVAAAAHTPHATRALETACPLSLTEVNQIAAAALPRHIHALLHPFTQGRTRGGVTDASDEKAVREEMTLQAAMDEFTRGVQRYETQLRRETSTPRRGVATGSGVSMTRHGRAKVS